MADSDGTAIAQRLRSVHGDCTVITQRSPGVHCDTKAFALRLHGVFKAIAQRSRRFQSDCMTTSRSFYGDCCFPI
jgi:hypothetical protein